jgi:hypothetical protein
MSLIEDRGRAQNLSMMLEAFQKSLYSFFRRSFASNNDERTLLAVFFCFFLLCFFFFLFFTCFIIRR